MPPPPYAFEFLPPTKLSGPLQWALPRYRTDRAGWILQRLSDQLQRAGGQGIITAIAIDRQHGGLAGAAVAVPQAARSATLLLLQADQRGSADPPDPELVTQLAAMVSGELQRRGISFVQASCDDPAQAQILDQAGFSLIADLELMTLQADQFAAATRVAQAKAEADGTVAAKPIWTPLQSLGEGWRETAVDVIGQTFIETLDCPGLNRLRCQQEIAADYFASAALDLRRWQLLSFDGRWAGGLLMTRHGGGSGPGAGQGGSSQPDPEPLIELTYMGLVPPFRGRGIAWMMLAELLRLSQADQASAIALAVDRQNAPALACYRHLGWRRCLEESVWGRRI